MSQVADALKASIQFDAERLANIAKLEELGALKEPSPLVGLVVFERVIKNGNRRQTYRAVRQNAGHWHLHLDGASINQTQILGWDHVVQRVTQMDNPIITHVEHCSAIDSYDLEAF